jgi:hypothetical protein
VNENSLEEMPQLPIRRITNGRIEDTTLEDLVSEGFNAEEHLRLSDEKARKEQENIYKRLNVKRNEILAPIYPPLTEKPGIRYPRGSMEHLKRVVEILQRVIDSGKYESVRVCQEIDEDGIVNPEGEYYIIYSDKGGSKQK